MNTKRNENGVILVIDDSPTNLSLLFTTLGKAGYQVLSAKDGESGIEQAIRMKPDIILLDVLMHGIDGFETCRRLKSNQATQNIPVLFMTVLTDMEDMLKGFRMGGVDYIKKPLQHEEVLARVNAHLTIQHQQKQLQEQAEQLKELNASKDKFFSIISRDLQSPFEELLYFTEFITENIEECSQHEIREIVGTLQDSVENLHELLRNLFTWSSVQRKTIEYHPQYIDLREIVTRNLSLFRLNAEQKHITLRSLIQNEMPVYADASMVYAVIRNLVSNALKFTEVGGKVRISALQNKEFVEISVSDTGIGICEEDLSKLFRIDVKYQQTGTAGEEGTGLGLILCKELVEKNSGSLSVKSEVGKGTTVTFTLPKPPIE
jgi:two-component system sensor histidine kinase/response regulator